MKFLKVSLFLFIALFSLNFFSTGNFLGVAKAEVAYDLIPSAPTTTTSNLYDIDIPLRFTTIISEVGGRGYYEGYYVSYFKVASGKDGSGTITSVDATGNPWTASYTFTTGGVHSVQACIKDAKKPTYDFSKINTNTSNDCSAWVNLNPGVPDLQMFSGQTFSRYQSTGDKDYTIYMTTMNKGNASTKIAGVNSFTNLIQMATELDSNSNPVGPVTNYGTYTINSLPVYDSSKSSSYNSVLKQVIFPSNGTFYVRTCADTDGVITESNENNNCNAWVRQIVGPQGTLSVTGCTIASGESTCNAKVTWTTQNLNTATTEVTRNNPNFTHVSWATSGTNVATPVTYGATSFYLSHDSKQIAPKMGDPDVGSAVSCASKNHWNGTICTPDTIPVITITQETANLSQQINTFSYTATITSDGANGANKINGFSGSCSLVTETGVVWNTTGNPTIADNKKTLLYRNGCGWDDWFQLPENGTYYLRAYAKNYLGISYSDQVTHKTGFELRVGVDGTGSGTTNPGGSNSYASGTIVTMTATPDANSTFTGWSGDNPDCSDGVVTITASTGCVATFTKKPSTAPSVTTGPITGITGTTANSTVTTGGVTATQAGIVWSSTSNPTVATNLGINKGGWAVGTSPALSMTGLTPNTTYHVRAYASSDNGAAYAYGSDVTFTTTGGTQGTLSVTTGPITNITKTSATSSVTTAGVSATDAGIIWSTASNPTVETNLGINRGGNAVGLKSLDMTGLTANTTYHVRAYARDNSTAAYTYGSDLTFIATDTPNNGTCTDGSNCDGGWGEWIWELSGKIENRFCNNPAPIGTGLKCLKHDGNRDIKESRLLPSVGGSAVYTENSCLQNCSTYFTGSSIDKCIDKNGNVKLKEI